MPLNQTLGTLAARLQTRLGFGAAGASAGVNLSMMYDLLFAAQTQLYWSHTWKPLRTYVTKTLGASQTLLDYPTEIHPERIEGVSIKISAVWGPFLHVGIEPELYTTQDSEGPPVRVDFYSQIEFYPQTDQSYEVRIWGQKPLNAFAAVNDETTLDPDLVFLYALALGKAHYGHSDAQLYADQLSQLTASLRKANFARKVFDPVHRETIVNPRPLVVGRDV